MEPTPSGSSTNCARIMLFWRLPRTWRAGSSPVAGTRQTLDSITSMIISLVIISLVMVLGLMETFFLFWCSVVGSVVVLMVGLLMVVAMLMVDILSIAVQLLTVVPAPLGRR